MNERYVRSYTTTPSLPSDSDYIVYGIECDMHNSFIYTILRHVIGYTTLNIPISEGGTNSCRVHNLVKSQRYERLKISPSDTKFMNTIGRNLVCACD